jgi:uncharacterized membrane protein (DUF4010 family)
VNPETDPPILGLAVALGAGLLIGIERERRKGEGDERGAAGLRSFAVVASSGALCQWLPVPGLVLVGAVLVAALAALSYAKSRSRDPGLTTEFALFATYLIGVQAVVWPALAAGLAAALAILLAMRERLHRLATRLLSEQELHDGLMLAALTLVVLPLVPDRPIDWLGGMSPRPLATLVLLIMVMQATGQIALRWLGPRGGALAAGFVSGFVSSTAAVASLGSRARAEPPRAAVLAAAAGLSTAATWVQVLVICLAVSPAGAAALWPVALAGALGASAVGLVALRRAPTVPPAAEAAAPSGSALRPREALAVAVTLGLVALGVGQAQQHFGDTGRTVGVALSALADAHAPVAMLASMHAASGIGTPDLVKGSLVAIAANSLSRCGVAAVAGGWAFAWRVALALGVGWAAAAAASWVGRLTS